MLFLLFANFPKTVANKGEVEYNEQIKRKKKGEWL
jgi:hypothetical protein